VEVGWEGEQQLHRALLASTNQIEAAAHSHMVMYLVLLVLVRGGTIWANLVEEGAGLKGWFAPCVC